MRKARVVHDKRAVSVLKRALRTRVAAVHQFTIPSSLELYDTCTQKRKTERLNSRKLKTRKPDMLRSVRKQCGESVESVLKKKRKAKVGRKRRQRALHRADTRSCVSVYRPFLSSSLHDSCPSLRDTDSRPMMMSMHFSSWLLATSPARWMPPGRPRACPPE